MKRLANFISSAPRLDQSEEQELGQTLCVACKTIDLPEMFRNSGRFQGRLGIQYVRNCRLCNFFFAEENRLISNWYTIVETRSGQFDISPTGYKDLKSLIMQKPY